MFLGELPEDAVESIDLTHKGGRQVYEEWRDGQPAADEGWEDAGVRPPKPRSQPAPHRPHESGYAEGMLVEHETYGLGRVTELSGYGALRKVKVRFNRAGEKTFIADKAKLAVVNKK